MKKIMAEAVIARIFCVLSILLFVVLFGLSVMGSWINDYDLVSEYVLPVKDSLISNLLWLAAILLLCTLLYGLGKRCRKPVNMDIVALVVSALAMVFSIYWVSASKTVPQADQVIVCNYAEAFDLGDCSGLKKGGYMAIFPQQLGLLTFIRVLFRLFGAGNYAAFQYFNAVMIPMLVFSGYGIVKKVSAHSKAAEIIYLLLMVTCVPLYCYVPFVYGEISSTALVMLAGWLFLECLEEFSCPKLIVMSVALGGAVQLRRNTLIFVIAFLIVAVVKCLQKLNKQTIAAILGILLGVVLFQAVVNGIYSRVTPEDSHPMPAILHIVMGTNDDEGRAGWHNLYTQATFAENNYDVEKSKAVAREDLEKFFEKCGEDPAYAVDFYYRKISCQWNAPMYQCLAMNNLFAGEQSALVSSVYFGKLRNLVEAEMNIYQLLVYGGVLILLLLNRRKWCQIEKYLLLVGVYGGFLFSIMWETKPRYVFPYFVVMIPYAAVGIYECVKCLHVNYRKCFSRKDVAK